jgi:homocysteine S-methyltransferase
MEAVRLSESGRFVTTVEVVPPAGPDAGTLLAALRDLKTLPVDAFSVATNPVAKARMSALALSGLIHRETGRRAILHCTTRDHNRLSLQGLLWGALALGIDTVLVTSGDFVALGDRGTVSTVRDTDVFGLIKMAAEAGLCTGVVIEPSGDLPGTIDRLQRKVAAGAQFAVTQPIYDEGDADALHDAVRHVPIPVHMGILPLRTPRHADFLHSKVAGIRVPQAVRERMHRAQAPVAEGAMISRALLTVARRRFAGACLMPPFDHYEVLFEILQPEKHRSEHP